MVVSADVIKTNSFFHVTWLLATGDPRKVSRREVLGQKVPNICDSILEMVPDATGGYRNKAGLYLLSLLTYGTVLVHRVQVDFLQRDVEKLKELLKRKSFIMLMAEKFDREHEENRKRERRGNKLRSQPISSVEDIDSWINLADLHMISENLGINGDVRDFTMIDAPPNNIPIDWTELNAENTGLYGAVDQPSSQKNTTMYSTFVEGNGSDERERRSDAVLLDLEELVTPMAMTLEEKTVNGEPRKRSVHEHGRPQDDVGESGNPVEITRTVENTKESLKYANFFLIDPFEEREPERLLETVHEDLSAVQQNKDNGNLIEPPPEPLRNYQEIIPEDPQRSTSSREKNPQPEELDLPNVPGPMQEKFDKFFAQLANLPEESFALPPPPQEDLEAAEPPPKKQKTLDEEQEEADMEKARRRASSRPVTPLNQTNLTNLQTTLRPEDEEDEEELSFKIDPEIHDPLPQQRKRARRNLPPIYGDDLEIDISVQKALLADWSSLVRKREDVLIKISPRTDSVAIDMFSPSPAFGLGKHIADEVREAFYSGTYRYYEEAVAHEKENRDEVEAEEQLRYATASLLPSDDFMQQYLEEQRTKMFEEEYRPPQFQEPARVPVDSTVLQQTLHEVVDDELRYVQACLRPSTPLEPEQQNASLLPGYTEKLNFACAYLLPTPEKVSEARIIEELQLEPMPLQNNFDTLDYSHRRLTMQQPGSVSHTVRTEENLENPRRHHKSSLGIRVNGSTQLKDYGEEVDVREQMANTEHTVQFPMDVAEQDPFVFSSGSLQNNRFLIHAELLTEAKDKYPEWIDFNEFTSSFTRKKAATSFEGLLLNLKNLKLRAKQEFPFDKIQVQHVVEDQMFDETQ